MKKNQTTFILIFSTVATILAVLIFFFFLKVIKNKNQHISVVLTTLQEKMKEKESTMIFAEKITEIKSIQNSIDSYFLDSNKINIFVDYLEEIGSNLGSRISVESIEIPSKTENIISVKLSIVGTFQKVMETITYLENIPYQVNVTQVYLNRDATEITQGSVKAVGQDKVSKEPTWQADVSFNVLSSN